MKSRQTNNSIAWLQSNKSIKYSATTFFALPQNTNKTNTSSIYLLLCSNDNVWLSYLLALAKVTVLLK